MKTVEWFASLSYGNIDILIPQAQILESNYSRFTSQILECIGFDELVQKFLGQPPSSDLETLLLIKEDYPYEIKTKAIPTVINLELNSLKLLNGPLGQHLRKMGITAFRSTEEKLQYVIEINKFLEACRK